MTTDATMTPQLEIFQLKYLEGLSYLKLSAGLKILGCEKRRASSSLARGTNTNSSKLPQSLDNSDEYGFQLSALLRSFLKNQAQSKCTKTYQLGSLFRSSDATMTPPQFIINAALLIIGNSSKKSKFFNQHESIKVGGLYEHQNSRNFSSQDFKLGAISKSGLASVSSHR